MADSIDIVLTDKVDSGISPKIEAIAIAAEKADGALERLQKHLSQLNASPISRLNAEIEKNNQLIDKNAIANQRLATETQKTATASANAATAQQRLATETQRTATASASATTAQQRTATAIQQTEAATSRAELAALRLKQAQERGTEANHAHGQSWLSMASSMAVGMLTAHAIMAVFDGITGSISGSIKAVDEFQMSGIQIAAVLTSLAENQSNIPETYKQSRGYAEGLNEELQVIDARTSLNLKNLQAISLEMAKQGVTLKLNNAEEEENMTRIANAVALYSRNGADERQVRQEISALMRGEVRQGDELAKLLDRVLHGNLKPMLAEWKAQDDVINQIGKRLSGFGPAGEEINGTWSAAVSSLETSVNIIQRAGFKTIVADVVELIQAGNGWLRSHADLIGGRIKQSWMVLKGLVEGTSDILRSSLWVLLEGIGGLTNKILTGWGLIASAIFPVVADEFKHMISFMNAIVNLGYSFGLVMIDAIGAAGEAMLKLGKSALQALTGDFAGAKETLSGIFTGVFSEKLKGNMEVVKGTIIAITEEWVAMQNPIDRILDKTDKFLNATNKKDNGKAPQAPKLSTPVDTEEVVDNLTALNNEMEKWRELQRATDNAYQKSKLFDIKSAADKELALLKNKHNQGLLDDREFIELAHAQTVKGQQAEIEVLTQSANKSAEAYNKAKELAAKPLSFFQVNGADANQAADAFNKAEEVKRRTEKEAVEAKQRLAEATAKGALEEIAFNGAIVESDSKVLDTILNLQIESAKLLGLDKEALELELQRRDVSAQGKKTNSNPFLKGIQDEIDALKRLKTAFEEAHKNDDVKNNLTDSLNYNNPYQLEIDAIDRRYGKEIEWLNKLKEAKKITTDQQERLDLIEKSKASDLHNFKVETWKKSAASFSDSLNTIGESLMHGNKQQFELGKKLAIASTIISTYLSAQQAFASLSGIPFVGPVLGAAAATAAVAAGLARVDAIKEQQYEASYAVGTPYVPKDMIAQIHQGEIVMDRSSADALRKYGIPTTGAADSYSRELVSSNMELKTAIQNNSLAVTRVANGLTKIDGSLKDFSATFEGLNGVGNSKTKDESFISSVLAAPFRSLNSLKDFIAMGFGNKVFGGGKTLDAAGLVLGYNNGLQAEQYTDIKRRGGLFGSANHYVNNQEAPDEVKRLLSQSVNSILATTLTAASALNVDNSGIKGTKLASENINLKGLDAEGAAKAVEQWLAKLGNSMANGVKGLDELRKPGEDSYVALIRLSQSLQTVNENAELTQGKLLSSSLVNADIASKLIDSMGGLDKYKEKTSDFFQNFYSAQEQAEAKAQQGYRQMSVAIREVAGASASIPNTREQFVNLVKSIDLTSESGRKMYAALMNISNAANDFYKANEERQKAQKALNNDVNVRKLKALGEDDKADLLSLQLRQQEELNAAKEKGLNVTQLTLLQHLEYNKLMKEQAQALAKAKISDAFDMLKRSIDAQKEAAKTLYETQSKAAKETVDKLTESVSKLKSLSEMFKSSLDSIKPLSLDQARVQLNSALNELKRTGNIADTDALKKALDTVTKPSLDNFANIDEYNSFIAKSAAIINELNKTANGKLTQQQTALDVANKQVELLEKTYNDEIKRLDKIVEGYQKQIDAINGVNNAVKTVPVAMKELALLLTGYNRVSVSGSAISVPTLTGTNGARTTSSEGTTLGTVDNTNKAILAELAAVKAELKALRQEEKSANVALVDKADTVARFVKKCDTIGMPETREAV